MMRSKHVPGRPKCGFCQMRGLKMSVPSGSSKKCRRRVVIGCKAWLVRFDWLLFILCSDGAVKKLFGLHAEAFVGLVCGDWMILKL